MRVATFLHDNRLGYVRASYIAHTIRCQWCAFLLIRNSAKHVPWVAKVLIHACQWVAILLTLLDVHFWACAFLIIREAPRGRAKEKGFLAHIPHIPSIPIDRTKEKRTALAILSYSSYMYISALCHCGPLIRINASSWHDSPFNRLDVQAYHFLSEGEMRRFC